MYDKHDHRVVLENLEISQFAQLLQKARKTAQFVKPSSEDWWEGIRYSPTNTMYAKIIRCAARQVDSKWSFQA